jgi:undecaprenyl-diphosphatase
MSLLLGLVQGITEFLPVSSSGHLSILQNIFNLNYAEDNHLFFEVLLHLGTLISIIVVYWDDIKIMLTDGLAFIRMRSDVDSDEPIVLRPPARALLFVIIGTFPMFIALIFSRSVKRLFFSLGFIGFALLVTGGLLFVSERYIEKGNKTERTMTLWDALIIGLSQAAAIVPGLSRSGTTISVGLACGLSGNFAVKFSLLLSIPAVIGATLVTLFSAIRHGINFSLIPVYLVGFIIAVVIGFFAIQFIRRIMNKGDFGKFAYYCWGAGLLTIILSFIF